MLPLLASFLLSSVPQAGAAPAAAAPAGRLLVLDKAAATAEILELPGGRVLARIATGQGPHEAALAPGGRLAAISNYGGREPGGSLTILDLVKLEAVRTIDLGEPVRPHGMAFEEDGAGLWVTAETVGQVWRLSFPEGRILERAGTGARVSHMVVLGADHAWVANIGSGSVTPVARADARARPAVATGEGAEGLAMSADGRSLWVTNRAADTVSVVATRERRVARSIPCPGFPIRVALAEGRGLALVSCPRDGDVKAFAIPDGAARGRIAIARQAGEEVGERLFSDRFGDSPTPIGMVLDGGGRWLFVALANADAVAVADLESMEVTAFLPTGKEPDGMAWIPPRP